MTCLIPKSQLVVVKRASHAVNFNSPDTLVHLVRSFLQGTAQDGLTSLPTALRVDDQGLDSEQERSRSTRRDEWKDEQPMYQGVPILKS